MAGLAERGDEHQVQEAAEVDGQGHRSDRPATAVLAVRGLLGVTCHASSPGHRPLEKLLTYSSARRGKVAPFSAIPQRPSNRRVPSPTSAPCNAAFAPPPVPCGQPLAVPVDMQRLVASVRFDVASQIAEVSATVELAVRPNRVARVRPAPGTIAAGLTAWPCRPMPLPMRHGRRRGGAHADGGRRSAKAAARTS